MKNVKIGTAAIVALVALRVCIGWHFYKEGAKKFNDPSFTSVPFLAGAKGPLAGLYRAFLPDYDGRARLNLETTETGRRRINIGRTKAAWEVYRDRAIKHFGFGEPRWIDAAKDRLRTGRKKLVEAEKQARAKAEKSGGSGEAVKRAVAEATASLRDKVQAAKENLQRVEGQKAAAEAVCAEAVGKLKFYFADNEDAIAKYLDELARLQDAKQDRALRDVAFRKAWIARQETKLRGELGGYLASIDKLWDDYEADIRALATPEQLAARGDYPLPRPGGGPIPIGWIDTFISYLVIIVGICLILGLFTRAASVAGAGFLASVISTQPPWVPGAADTYYQAVELCALLVLAVFAAGRYAGLDFLIHAGWVRCFGMKKQGTSDESNA